VYGWLLYQKNTVIGHQSHSFETQPGPVGRLGDPAKPGCNPLIFFLLKRRCFEFFFKYKLTWTTWSESETRTLDRTYYQAGFQNYDQSC
jgi:hypothetical protein